MAECKLIHDVSDKFPKLAFFASTGRTATMFMASTLDSLPKVKALHEGHEQTNGFPVLPLINLQNRAAWNDRVYAYQTVKDMRNQQLLSDASRGSDILIDLAYYNSPLVSALKDLHPESRIFLVFRRCESFVRSATIVSGEDRQPAGWSDVDKTLTAREQFIAMGRLKPDDSSHAGKSWGRWSAIQRNIWLWCRINSHLFKLSQTLSECSTLFFEKLAEKPSPYWTDILTALGIYSTSNLDACLLRSKSKLNSRTNYQVGPMCSWTKSEISYYKEFAVPLEERIYDGYQ